MLDDELRFRETEESPGKGWMFNGQIMKRISPFFVVLCLDSVPWRLIPNQFEFRFISSTYIIYRESRYSIQIDLNLCITNKTNKQTHKVKFLNWKRKNRNEKTFLRFISSIFNQLIFVYRTYVEHWTFHWGLWDKQTHIHTSEWMNEWVI